MAACRWVIHGDCFPLPSHTPFSSIWSLPVYTAKANSFLLGCQLYLRGQRAITFHGGQTANTGGALLPKLPPGEQQGLELCAPGRLQLRVWPSPAKNCSCLWHSRKEHMDNLWLGTGGNAEGVIHSSLPLEKRASQRTQESHKQETLSGPCGVFTKQLSAQRSPWAREADVGDG